MPTDSSPNRMMVYKDIPLILPSERQLEPNFLDAIGGTKRLYVWGHVDYDDAFDHPLHLYFCYRFSKSTFTQNYYEYCDHYNGEIYD